MKRTFLMCPPDFFEVTYEINAWMHVDNPVDVELAKKQWQKLHDTYVRLGHQVKIVDPVKGLPDMVFTANGGLVIDGKVMLPRFLNVERQPETPRFEQWFRQNGYSEIMMPTYVSEGEGDILYAHGTIFAGYGYRSELQSHSELETFFDKPVISLKMIDPRFYHLDTAMAPINDDTLIYFPDAFDTISQAHLAREFKTLIPVTDVDAAGFGLNMVSDGENVMYSADSKGIGELVKQHGFNPLPHDMSEFRKSGGAVKCCTLELRA